MTTAMRYSVYVAGASSERETRARPVIEALRLAGYDITHDWTQSVDMHGANNEHGHLTPEELKRCAADDMRGVKDADFFVLLAPEAPSTGAWAELGMALAYGCIVLVAGNCDHCIFSWLLEGAAKFDTDAALVESMECLARRKR